MSKVAHDPLYRRHRFPAEIIAHAVWLYFRFPLSLRMVEDVLAARDIIVTHQTIRTWAEKFGRHFANEIRRRSAGRLGDKWHLDEVVVGIAGTKHWLWRAVDQEGFVLDVLVQSRRNAKAARRLMRKLLKGQGRAPRVMITDKLGSYAVAGTEMMPGVEHRRHKGLNNRAENSHQPTRRRETIMKRFKSARQLQRLVSIHDPIANLFHFPSHALSSSDHRDLRSAAMATWREITHIADIGTSPGAIGTAVGQQHLKSILSFCNSPMMSAIEAYIQFTPDLISDNGEVSSGSTETFLRDYMSEFSNFIGRVLTVFPRTS